jgi:hypothetical protein
MKTQAQIDATKAYQAKWRADNADKRAEDHRRWREKNADHVKQKSVAYATANAEAIRAKRAAKYLENVEAERAKRAKFRRENGDRLRAEAKARYEKNREVALTKAAEYREKNQEAIRASRVRNKAQTDAYAARYRQENAEKLKALNREWHAAHPEVRLAAMARRRANKLARTPNWDVELTDLVTKEAAHLTRLRGKATGFSWHVDHTLPLQGKHVSGLHTWSNLRVIPATMNRRKSNLFQPT